MAKNLLRKYLHDRKVMFQKYLNSLKSENKKEETPQKTKTGRAG